MGRDGRRCFSLPFWVSVAYYLYYCLLVGEREDIAVQLWSANPGVLPRNLVVRPQGAGHVSSRQVF